jgi:hypothetical protein
MSKMGMKSDSSTSRDRRGNTVMMAFWHLLKAFAEPPEDKPDLWVVVNACFEALEFGICYLWCMWKLVLKSGLLDVHLPFRESQDSKKLRKAAPRRHSSVA